MITSILSVVLRDVSFLVSKVGQIQLFESERKVLGVQSKIRRNPAFGNISDIKNKKNKREKWPYKYFENPMDN